MSTNSITPSSSKRPLSEETTDVPASKCPKPTAASSEATLEGRSIVPLQMPITQVLPPDNYCIEEIENSSDHDAVKKILDENKDPSEVFKRLDELKENPFAKWTLGLNILHHHYPNHKQKEAFKIFQELIDASYYRAYHTMGCCYMWGLGKQQDHEQALEYFRQGKEKGDLKSIRDYYFFCLPQKDTEKEEAQKAMKSLIEYGDQYTNAIYGSCCADGIFGEKNYKESIKYLTLASNAYPCLQNFVQPKLMNLYLELGLAHINKKIPDDNDIVAANEALNHAYSFISEQDNTQKIADPLAWTEIKLAYKASRNNDDHQALMHFKKAWFLNSQYTRYVLEGISLLFVKKNQILEEHSILDIYLTIMQWFLNLQENAFENSIEMVQKNFATWLTLKANNEDLPENHLSSLLQSGFKIAKDYIESARNTQAQIEFPIVQRNTSGQIVFIKIPRRNAIQNTINKMLELISALVCIKIEHNLS